MPQDTENTHSADRQARRASARQRTAGFLATDTTAWVGGFVAAVWTRFEFQFPGPTGSGSCRRPRRGGGARGGRRAAPALLRPTPAGQLPGGPGRRRHHHHHGRHRAARPAAVRRAAGSGEHTLVGGALALLFMLGARFAYRHRRDLAMRPDVRSSTPVLLFGMGDAGQGLLRAMLGDPRGRYLPVGALDDDPDKRDLRIGGVRVLGGRHEVTASVRRTGATTVIFSVANADAALIRQIREATLKADAVFKVLPRCGTWSTTGSPSPTSATCRSATCSAAGRWSATCR
ncbi:hypothetical protein NKG94_19795 [Micromonospora sp. M12]